MNFGFGPSSAYGTTHDMSAKTRILSAFSRFSDQKLCEMYSVKRAGCGGKMTREGRLQRLATYYMSRQGEIKAFLDAWATEPMDIDEEWEFYPTQSGGTQNNSLTNNTFNFDAVDTSNQSFSFVSNPPIINPFESLMTFQFPQT